MSKISVVVPVYKVEKYLHRCIDSILAQTFTDFELILVDDGSPDNCGKICEDYAKKDSRIVVIHKENGGLSDARNAGIDWSFENSDSEWITFIDSDDWVHSKYLESLYNANIKFNTDISVCDYFEFRDNSDLIEITEFDTKKMCVKEFALKYHRLTNPAWAKIYRKQLFENIHYPVGKLHEDAFTTYKLLFNTKAVSMVNAPLYYYYLSNDSIMRATWTPKRLDEFEALKERVDFYRENGFEKLHKKEALNLIFREYEQLRLMKKEKDNIYISEYAPIIRKIMRKSIKYYNKRWDDFPLKGNEYMYEFAYPKKMQFHWILIGIKNKFNRD